MRGVDRNPFSILRLKRDESFNVGRFARRRESGISTLDRDPRDSPIEQHIRLWSERYVLTFDNQAFVKRFSIAPYDFVEILANNQTYGGGGIFNLYSTVAADQRLGSICICP
jgi:hypothetical protein